MKKVIFLIIAAFPIICHAALIGEVNNIDTYVRVTTQFIAEGFFLSLLSIVIVYKVINDKNKVLKTKQILIGSLLVAAITAFTRSFFLLALGEKQVLNLVPSSSLGVLFNFIFPLIYSILIYKFLFHPNSSKDIKNSADQPQITELEVKGVDGIKDDFNNVNSVNDKSNNNAKSLSLILLILIVFWGLALYEEEKKSSEERVAIERQMLDEENNRQYISDFLNSQTLQYADSSDKIVTGCFDFDGAEKLGIKVEDINLWISLHINYDIGSDRENGLTEEQILKKFRSMNLACRNKDF